jgi:four helix bundle protein
MATGAELQSWIVKTSQQPRSTSGTERATTSRVEHKTYRDLLVWQQSMVLVEDVYNLCASLPADERFGLSAQLKRAAVSIPSNIGEGARRKRPAVFRYHLEVALGSQAEVEVQVEVAKRLGFIDATVHDRVQQRVNSVGRLLNKLLDSV